VRTKSGRIGRGDDREVGVLRDVVGDAVEPVDPHRAHGAGPGLLLAVHELVNDQVAPGSGEQLAQAYGPYGSVTGVEVGGALL